MYRKVFAEMLGTYFLLVTVGISNGEPFAIGGTLWCLIVLTGFVSDGIFNPAISLSLILNAHLNKKLTKSCLLEYLAYSIAQFIFAILGSLTAWAIVNHTVHYSVMDGYNVAEAFFAEMIYTTMLACNNLILGRLNKNRVISGGIVAMTVTAGGWAIGKVSGGCFNPAVGLSINLVAYINTSKHMGDTWIYIFAPALGAILGTFMGEFFGRELDSIKKYREENIEEEEITINLEE